MGRTVKAGGAGPLPKLALFLAIAFLLPLFCVQAMTSWPLFQTGPLSLVLYGVEAMSPTLAALICAAVFGGAGGLRCFLRKSYLENVSPKLIAIAFAIPFVVFLAARLVTIPLTGAEFEFMALNPAQWVAVSWALIAEELGWRGYLQDQLGPLLKPMLIPLVTGLLWAAWHYHFFMHLSIDVPAVLFFLGCVAESYAYYALTVSADGNVIPASVFHFSGNLAINLFTVYPFKNNGSTLPYVAGIAVMSAIALVMNLRLRRKLSYERA